MDPVHRKLLASHVVQKMLRRRAIVAVGAAAASLTWHADCAPKRGRMMTPAPKKEGATDIPFL